MALACTTVVVDDKVCDGPVVSGRTFHFFDEINHRVASVARNAKNLLMRKITPTKASTYGEYLDNKHAFMCMEIEAGASEYTICNDGYNEKGLAMSLQAMNRFGYEDDWRKYVMAVAEEKRVHVTWDGRECLHSSTLTCLLYLPNLT